MRVMNVAVTATPTKQQAANTLANNCVVLPDNRAYKIYLSINNIIIIVVFGIIIIIIICGTGKTVVVFVRVWQITRRVVIKR